MRDEWLQRFLRQIWNSEEVGHAVTNFPRHRLVIIAMRQGARVTERSTSLFLHHLQQLLIRFEQIGGGYDTADRTVVFDYRQAINPLR